MVESNGHCTRHPDEVIISNGKKTSCKICASEQERVQDESLRYNIVGDTNSRQSQDSQIGRSISKMVTSLSAQNQVPRTVDTVKKNGSENHNNNNSNNGNNNNNGINHKNGNANNDSSHNSRTGIAIDTEEEEEVEEEEGGMEELIARWCQLQDASGAPSADMLGSTLILLSLQKLERRVQVQETSIQSLADTMAKQQSSIQNDLSRILNYMAASALNAQSAQQQLLFPMISSHTTGGGVNETRSAVSALSGESGSTQNSGKHQHSGRQNPNDSTQLRSRTNSLHPSSNFQSVRTIERQPPQPPKRHDSFRSMGQSLGGAAPGVVSSGDLSSSSTTLGGVGSPVTASGQPTSAVARDPKMTFAQKSSFRNSRDKLDIIWDASDHTSGQQSPHKSQSDSKSSTPATVSSSLLNTAKHPPTLASSLDDSYEDDDGSAKLFSGMKTWMEMKKDAAAGIPALVNHESMDTFCVESTCDDDETELHNSLQKSIEDNVAEHDVDVSEQPSAELSASEPTEEYLQVSAETDDEDDEDDDDDTHDDTEDNKKNKKKSKKERRREKKERKKEKKKEKKAATILNNKVSPAEEEKEKKTRTRKKRRFTSATKKILWKRSSKHSKEDDSATTENNSKSNGRAASTDGPVLPQRQASGATKSSTPNEFCVFNDNPRSHLMPTPSTLSTLDFDPISPPTAEKPLAHKRQADTTDIVIGTTTTTTTEAEETMTVKTPLTARTPMTARTPRDAVQKINPENLEPPPPPEQEKRYRPELQQPTIKPGHMFPYDNSHAQASPSQQQRRRAPFPRSRHMMPTVFNSKREIIITGESSRMHVSTLTLDTALPSADAGSVLQEVAHQTITDKCKERGTYTGTVNENEEPDGFGTMIYNSGAFYKGHWKEGHWHGDGILRTPNGDSYEGDFVYDCRHGRGIYKYENGDVYEGDFSSDKRHGKGTFLFQNGSMYRGDFAYGNFHGYGWYEFDEGYYEGSWMDGVYEGIGSLIYKDGSHYTGRFKTGVADGMGEEMKTDGTSKRGMWKNGEFIGQVEQVQPAILRPHS